MYDIDVVAFAKSFATDRHTGQVRKYTGAPYITHPAAVARYVRMVGGSAEMIAAAWMHDLIEDTGTTRHDIADRFGQQISWMVFDLTDRSLYAMDQLPRRERKRLDADALSRCSGDVQTVKMADLLDNSRSIIAFDPKFAKVYIREAEYLVEVLIRAEQRITSAVKSVISYYRRNF